MLLIAKSNSMIKSKRIPLLFLACLFSLFLVSCGKNGDDGPAKSRTELLTTGSWKIASVGVDFNKDGKIDFPYSLEDCETDNTYSFLDGGEGIADEGTNKCDPSSQQTATFAWSFKNDEKILNINFPGSILSRDTNIKTLSESKLEVYFDYDDPDSGMNVRIYLVLSH